MNPMHLVAYARARGLAYGWRRRTIPWVLDVTDPAAPTWREHGAVERVPYARRSGSGAHPRPGCDNVTYLCGKHASTWRQAALEAAEGSPHPAAAGLRAALNAGPLPHPPARAKDGDLAAVRAGDAWWHDDPMLADWWADHLRAGLDSGQDGVCLCCMTTGRMARLIPAYLPPHSLGVRGSGDIALYPTPTRGAAAHRASDAMMCLDCAMDIGAAVATIATDRDHHYTLTGGGVLLCWDPGGAEPWPLWRLLVQPSRQGLAVAPRDGRVCALLLTARSPGRATVVRHWDLPAAHVAERVAAWYGRITVEESWSDRETIPSIWGLHKVATHRWDKDREELVPTQRATRLSEVDLWVAALNGHTPRRHIAAVHKAIGRDGHVRAGRAALLQTGLAR